MIVAVRPAMSAEVRQHADLRVRAESVGGIDRCELTFDSGVTLLVGQNATNRTSTLTALRAIFGGRAPAIKSDSDEATVTLEIDDETYSRRYVREDGSIVADGTPFVDNADLVNVFAALLEDNEARRAVERGESLHDVIMRPIDTAEIEARLHELQRRRDRLTSRIDEIEAERERLPELTTRRKALEAEREEIVAELDSARDSIEAYEFDGEGGPAQEIQERLSTLQERSIDLDERISRQESELASLREEREEIGAERSDIDVMETELASVESEIEQLRRREREVDEAIADLTHIIEFNDDVLSGGEYEVLERDDGSVTEALDPTPRTVRCWTCGGHVETDEIADRLDGLRELAERRREKRNRIRDDLEGLEERRNELRRPIRRRERLESRLENVEEEIEVREAKLRDLEADRAEVREEIEELRARAEETEGIRENDLVDASGRISELEFERGRIDRKLEEVIDEVEEIEDRVDELDEIEAEWDRHREEIGELQSRIENLERSAVEEFNEHMAEVLELLDYGNVERVWIERRTDEGGGSRSVTFTLHVVREDDEGVVYEDTVDHLSESEREVIGLVVALAGYLAHETYEVVPIMLLDSLEAIDATRIAPLVDYFSDYAPYLIVAVLPEVERTLSADYDRIPASELHG